MKATLPLVIGLIVFKLVMENRMPKVIPGISTQNLLTKMVVDVLMVLALAMFGAWLQKMLEQKELK